MEFTMFSRHMGLTPPSGGYFPCMVLLKSGHTKQVQWICPGSGDDYSKVYKHFFYDLKDKLIDEDTVMAFLVLPKLAHQITIKTS